MPGVSLYPGTQRVHTNLFTRGYFLSKPGFFFFLPTWTIVRMIRQHILQSIYLSFFHHSASLCFAVVYIPPHSLMSKRTKNQGGIRVAYTEEMSQFADAEEDVDPGAVDRWLAATGTLESCPPSINALQGDGVGGGGGGGDSADGCSGRDMEGDGPERYDCGLESCCKSFPHDHFLAGGEGGLPRGFEQRF